MKIYYSGITMTISDQGIYSSHATPTDGDA